MLNKLKNLIGGKSDGFFLEMDETDQDQSNETKVEAATTEEALPEAVTEAIDKVADVLEPATAAIKEAVASEPVTGAIDKVADVLEPATTAIKEAVASEPVQEKATKKSNKTSVKSKTKKSEKTAPTPSATSSGGATSWDQPAWVKAMYKNNTSSSNGKSGGGEQTFATDNLMPTPSAYRRRPGPSLNKFKEMARQAKTP